MSRAGAARGKILRLPLDGAPALAAATVIVPESDGAIQDFVPTQSRLYINDLLGGPSRVRIVALDGKSLGDLPVLPVSSVRGIVRLEGDDVLFDNTSYLRAPAWFHFAAATGAVAETALVMTSVADYSDAEVVRDFARSKDGISNWQRLAANPIVRSDPGQWDHDACYKPYAIFDGEKWLLWYNGRHGGLEQIGVALHPGEDLGF